MAQAPHVRGDGADLRVTERGAATRRHHHAALGLGLRYAGGDLPHDVLERSLAVQPDRVREARANTAGGARAVAGGAQSRALEELAPLFDHRRGDALGKRCRLRRRGSNGQQCGHECQSNDPHERVSPRLRQNAVVSPKVTVVRSSSKSRVASPYMRKFRRKRYPPPPVRVSWRRTPDGPPARGSSSGREETIRL